MKPFPLLLACATGIFPRADAAAPRELSTDRPDTTESPYTVDAGHFQFEMEIASWTRDGSAREYALGELNSKFGLDASTDLQVITPFYLHESGGPEGFGEVEIRLKHNLWGNDGGTTALAVMPYIKLPTANGDLGSGETEGGLIVPLAFDGPAGWECGTMAELDALADEEGGGHHVALLVSATASHDLTETTGVFLELAGMLSGGSGSDHEAYFNTGLTWSVTPAWQLDGGVRVGLTAASTELMPFAGASAKF